MPDVIYGDYEWDENKDIRNREKHEGLGFLEAIRIFDDIVYTDAAASEYGEERLRAIGMFRGMEIVVVYTLRRQRKRIISARRAKRYEREEYYQFLSETDDARRVGEVSQS